MDETLTTNATEPIVVEGANTSDVNTAGYAQTQDVDTGSAVVETPTPMDNNVTYENIPDTTPEFNMDQTMGQNILQRAVQSSYESNLDANSGTAMDQFLNQDYSYDKSEAGTYWVAGAINDVETQMSFLNTLIREDMYDAMDLQKYYYDTTMATARAYAASKEKETAYGFYRAAQEKAIAEAQLTGWYMPAEGNYMLGQYTVAQNVLDSDRATDEEKARATRIAGTVEKWFNANQIGTRGIKCLNLLNHEENVRHNTIMGELQKEANQIAAAGNAINAAGADLQLRQYIFDLEEYELATGHNITKEIGIDNEDFLGHDIKNNPDYAKYQALRGGGNLGQVLRNSDSFTSILSTRNRKWLSDSLGEENYKHLNEHYEASSGDSTLADITEKGSNTVPSKSVKETQNTIASGEDGAGHKVWLFSSHSADGTPETRAYYKDGDTFVQIKKDVKLSNNQSLSDVVSNFKTSNLEYKGQGINVGDNFNYSAQSGSVTSNSSQYKDLSKKQKATIKEQGKKGLHMVDSYIGTDKRNTSVIMAKETDDGIKYYEVERNGTLHEVADNSKIHKITISGNPGDTVFSYQDEHNSGNNIAHAVNVNSKVVKETNLNDESVSSGNLWNSDHAVHAAEQFRTIGEVKGEGGMDRLALYTNPDGSTVLLEGKAAGHYGWDYKIISQEDATKKYGISADKINKYTESRTNYSNAYIPGTESTTTTQTTTKNTSLPLGHASVDTADGFEAQDTVDKREALFEKYNVPMGERREYIDILDPKELEEKLKEERIYYGSFLGKE